MNDPILAVTNLRKYFPLGGGTFRKPQLVRAVDDVSFTMDSGKTLGLVGESGCGKTTVGRTVIGLYRPTAGKIFFEGSDVFATTRTNTQIRRQMQMIFQDPYASLNPRMTVGDTVGEPMDIHRLAGNRRERLEKVQHLLDLVGLNPDHINRYPHEFSGGQRQRVGIARALAVEPKFIVCDEPISAVDVSIQAQIVNTLEQLQEDLHLTFLFIAHDLSMVKYISHRVAVMYLGKIVEVNLSSELYAHPLHPYTRALLSAVPIADPPLERKRRRILLEGDVPSPINPPPGCCFHTRCNRALPICREVTPEMEDLGNGHLVACHNYQ